MTAKLGHWFMIEHSPASVRGTGNEKNVTVSCATNQGGQMNWDDGNTDDTDEGKTILSLRSRIHG